MKSSYRWFGSRVIRQNPVFSKPNGLIWVLFQVLFIKECNNKSTQKPFDFIHWRWEKPAENDAMVNQINIRILFDRILKVTSRNHILSFLPSLSGADLLLRACLLAILNLVKSAKKWPTGADSLSRTSGSSSGNRSSGSKVVVVVPGVEVAAEAFWSVSTQYSVALKLRTTVAFV